MEPGSKVWIRDEEFAWLPGTVTDDGEKVRLEPGNQLRKIGELQPRNSGKATEVQDLVKLVHLNEAGILHVLRRRFEAGLIYTSVGEDILIAANPYRDLAGYYGEDIIAKFDDDNDTTKKPHIYAAAKRALLRLASEKRSQSILISGESGAGKTETTKHAIRYLATVSGRQHLDKGFSTVEEGVVAANPALEGLGNAATMRNHNSSRFGKLISLQFKNLSLHSAQVTTTLLEKVRCVHRSSGRERGFHIFYELLSDEKKDLLEVSATTKGGPQLPHGTDQTNLELRRKALTLVFGSKAKVDRFFQALIGLAHFACLDFESTDHDDTADFVDANKYLDTAVHMAWEAPNDQRALAFLEKREAVTKAILQRSVGSVVVPNTVAAAYRARDACIKLAYSQLFDGLVNKCNTLLHTLGGKNNNSTSSFLPKDEHQDLSISVLDIFGFEAHEAETGAENSLEQLLINYANEKLQRHFVEYVFEQERSIYADEGVLDEVIATTENCSFDTFGIENVATLRVLDGAKHALLQTLDEECILRSRAAALPRSSSDPQPMLQPEAGDDIESSTDKAASSALVRRFKTNISKFDSLATTRFVSTPRDERDGSFKIKHFAAVVNYSAALLTSKNMDAVPRAVADLLPLPMAKDILPTTTTPLIKTSASGTKRRASSKRTLEIDTVSLRFQKSLADLSRDIGNTKPTFIRCLKPNDQQDATRVDRPRLVDQLRYCGVLDAVRVARAGYPVRLPHDAFLRRYATIVPVTNVQEEHDDPDLWRAIIRHKSRRVDEDDDDDDALDTQVVTHTNETMSMGTAVSKAQALTLAKALLAPATPENGGILVGANRVFLKRNAYEKLERKLTTHKHSAVTKIAARARGRYQLHQYLQLQKATLFIVACIRGWLTRARLSLERKKRIESSGLLLTKMARSVLAIRCVRRLRAENVQRGEENYLRAAIACQSAFRGTALRAAFAYSALKNDPGARRFAAAICRRGAAAPVSKLELTLRQKKIKIELDAAIASSAFEKAASHQKWLSALQGSEKRMYADTSKIGPAFLVEAEIAKMQLQQLDPNSSDYQRHSVLHARIERADELRLALCPSKRSLTTAKNNTEEELQEAVQKREFQTCALLEPKLARLSALIEAYGDDQDDEDDETMAGLIKLRETLDTKLIAIEKELEAALIAKDFERCTLLQNQVADIKNRLHELETDPEPRLIDARARRAAAAADNNYTQAALARIQVKKWERRASLGPLPPREKRASVVKKTTAPGQRFGQVKVNKKSRSVSTPPAPLVAKQKPLVPQMTTMPTRAQSKDDDAVSVASTSLAPSVRTLNSTATSKASTTQTSKKKTVKKLRPEPAILLTSGTSIREACALMAAKRSDCVLVVSDEGGLLSIATDKDVVRGLAEHPDNSQWPDVTAIDAIATPNPTCVQAADDAMTSISLMVAKRWRHLPVMEDDAIVGVLRIQRCLTEAIERAQKRIGKNQWSSLKQLETVDPTLAKALMPLLTDARTLRTIMTENNSQLVHPETTVIEAARLMASSRRAVAVVRDQSGLDEIGILTPKDIVCRVIAKDLDPHLTLVASVETPDADTAEADATCLDCLTQMHDGAYLNCPVVDRSLSTVLGVVEVMELVYASGLSSIENGPGDDDDQDTASVVSIQQPRDSVVTNKSTVAKLRPDTNVVIFAPDDKLIHVCTEMAMKRTDVALIVEESQGLIGLVTDHDIAFKAIAEDIDLEISSVALIMSPAPACVRSTDGAVDALTRMVKHKIRHLPVLVDGVISGILHIRKCLNDAIEKIEMLEQKKAQASENDDLASVLSTALGKDVNSLLGPLMASLSGHKAKTIATLLATENKECALAASSTVLEAARQMQMTRKAVLSTDAQGKILGILTPRDILMRCIAKHMDTRVTTVTQVHTVHPETATSTTTLLEAMQKMHDGGFLHLPIIDESKIVGVVDVITVAWATMGDDHAEEGWSTLMLIDNDQASVVDDRASATGTVPQTTPGKTVDQLRPDRSPLTASADEMIASVCEKMLKRRTDCCLIVGDDNQVVGLVTDSDVARRAVAKRMDLHNTSIKAIMTENPKCVEASSPALDALQLMITSRFRHLVVSGPAVLHVNRCLYAAITLLEQLTERAKKRAQSNKQRIAETVLDVVKSGKTAGSAAMIGPLLESLTGDKAATVSTLFEDEDRSNCILSAEASVRAATEVMAETRRAVTAVDAEGQLVGILSPNDVLLRVAAVDKNADETSIAEVMTANPQTTTKEATLLSVLEQMHDGRVLFCPVVGDTVLGIIDVIEVAMATVGKNSTSEEQQAWSALMLSTGDDGSETASVRSTELAADISSNNEKKVADLRPEKRPVIASSSTSIAELCTLMLKRRTDCALITNDAALVGIVTDTDIARKVVAEGLHPHLTIAESIMTPKPNCVLGSDLALDSLKLMVSNRFRHLPVLDRAQGKIVGVLNIHRCLYAAIEKIEKLETALQEKKKDQDQEAALAAVLQAAVSASSKRNSGVNTQQLVKMLGPLMDSLGGQKRVGDVIVTNSTEAVVSAFAPVRRAAEIMATTRCAVLATDDEGGIVGILSPKDLAFRVLAQDLDPDSTSVEEVCTPDPDTILADAPLLEALQMMSDRHYGHLPVVDAEGQVAGVVDVMGMVHATMEGSDGWSTLMATTVGDEHDDETASQLSYQAPSRHRQQRLLRRDEDRLSTTSFDHRGLDNLESQYIYKIVDKRTGHLHRIQASDEIFLQVAEAVSKRLRLNAVHLTYQDEDGDDIVLTDDHSLVDAVAYARSSGRPLKLNATAVNGNAEAGLPTIPASPVAEALSTYGGDESSRPPPPPPAANNSAVLYISLAAMLAIVCVASLSSSSRAR